MIASMRRMPAAIDDSPDNLDDADIAGVGYVCAAAQLNGVAVADYANLVAVFLAEESHGAHFAGFGDRHVAVLVESHGHAHALVGQALYLGDFFGGELLEV